MGEVTLTYFRHCLKIMNFKASPSLPVSATLEPVPRSPASLRTVRIPPAARPAWNQAGSLSAVPCMLKHRKVQPEFLECESVSA